MTTMVTSRRARMRESLTPFLSFFTGSFLRLNGEPDIANFAVGNPQEMPMASYVDALRRHVEPRNKDLFAYKMSEPE